MPHPTDRYCAIVTAPFGAMGIRTEAAQIIELAYLPPDTPAQAPANACAELASQQMRRYFKDPAHPFTLPLAAQGTTFQRKVWQAIAAIPVGQVRTYGEIARQLDTAAQAVGQACGANFYPLVIPCHRVTASNGLGGFARQNNQDSYQLAAKRWLLHHETAQASGY